MQVCVITDDKMIQIDGEALNFDFTIDKNIHAIQWDGSIGEIEYKDGSSNKEITSFEEFNYLIDAFATEKQDVFDRVMETKVSLEDFRMTRNSLLDSSDWRMLSDYPNDDKEDWVLYRQQLRDCPHGYTPTNKPVYPTMPGALL